MARIYLRKWSDGKAVRTETVNRDNALAVFMELIPYTQRGNLYIDDSEILYGDNNDSSDDRS
jgi:hypothetical protein